MVDEYNVNSIRQLFGFEKPHWNVNELKAKALNYERLAEKRLITIRE